METENRRCEIYDDIYQEWVGVLFGKLVKGDTFRLFEPDGTPVTSNRSCSTFVATSDSYLEKGIYTICYKDFDMKEISVFREKETTN